MTMNLKSQMKFDVFFNLVEQNLFSEFLRMNQSVNILIGWRCV